MRRCIIILLFLRIASISLCAEQTEILVRGRIVGDKGPLRGVIITHIESGSVSKEYAISDSKGNFSLTVSAPISSKDSLRMSLLGYASKTVPIYGNSWIEVQMDVEPLNIKEAVFVVPKVKQKEDTITYYVQSFIESHDKTISDVLRRLPGVDVMSDGTIFYNGKSIGNLYIEGMDVLGGRYSLLTNNISAEEISKIEVIENHQPIKALAETRSTNGPAINLKLRDSARGKWLGTAEISAGISSNPCALWGGNLFIMHVSPKINSINNLKTNNLGENLQNELQSKSVYDRLVKTGTDNFVSIGINNAPLGDHRVRFNATTLANSSNLWKLKNSDWQIKMSLSYLFDRLESENMSSTIYYLNDSSQTVQEKNETMTRLHEIQARLESELNQKHRFFRNVVNIEGKFTEASQWVTRESPNNQMVKTPSILVLDDIKYISKNDVKLFDVESLNDFSYFTQNLFVVRGDGNTQRQLISVMNFNTNTNISTNFEIKEGLKFSVSAGVKSSVRSLKSILDGMEVVASNPSLFINDIVAAYILPNVKLDMKYSSKKLNIDLSLPVGWGKYWGVNTNQFTYKAIGTVKYTPVPKFSITVWGTASSNELDISNFYNGYILRNYRYLKTGTQNTYPDHYYNITGHLNYRDPVNMFYLDGVAGYSWNMSQASFAQDFMGDYIVLGVEYVPSFGESFYAMMSGNVGLYGINGKIGATINFRDYISTAMYQNGEMTPYMSRFISFVPTFTGRFTGWLSVDYNMRYSYYALFMSGHDTSDVKNMFSHTLTLNITPVKKLDIRFSTEHYFTTITSELTKNTFLLDANIVYQFDNGMKLNLVARNLLNQHSYVYSVFNALQDFSSEYRIRPLNIVVGVSFKF